MSSTCNWIRRGVFILTDGAIIRWDELAIAEENIGGDRRNISRIRRLSQASEALALLAEI